MLENRIVFTESAIDGLLRGFAGGAPGSGIAGTIQYFYWSAPEYEGLLEK